MVTPTAADSSGDPAVPAARSSWTPLKLQFSLLESVIVWEGKGDDMVDDHCSSHRKLLEQRMLSVKSWSLPMALMERKPAVNHCQKSEAVCCSCLVQAGAGEHPLSTADKEWLCAG